MKKVVAFGVFDILHPGHLHFLESAKTLGDHLTVVVTRDARTQKEKGKKPFFNESERLTMVQALKFVDVAILGDRPGQWTIAKKLHPAIIALGYDQDASFAASRGYDSATMVRIPKKPGRFSQSKRIREHILKSTL